MFSGIPADLPRDLNAIFCSVCQHSPVSDFPSSLKWNDANVTDGVPPEESAEGDRTAAADDGSPTADTASEAASAAPDSSREPPTSQTATSTTGSGDHGPPTRGGSDGTGRNVGAWLKANWVPTLGVLLIALTVLAIMKALNAKPDDALGKLCVIAAIPLLSISIGVLVNRFFHDLSTTETLRRDVQMAALTTYHLRSSVQYVDERLRFAIGLLLQNFQESEYNAYALLQLVSAKTATELAFGMAQQSARQFEMISPAGATVAKDIFTADEGEARPKIAFSNDPNFANAGGDDGNG
jgi:hypothetical protein